MKFEQKKTSHQKQYLHESILRVTTTVDLDLSLGLPCINKPQQFIRDLFAMRTETQNGCV